MAMTTDLYMCFDSKHQDRERVQVCKACLVALEDSVDKLKADVAALQKQTGLAK